MKTRDHGATFGTSPPYLVLLAMRWIVTGSRPRLIHDRSRNTEAIDRGTAEPWML
jgi:hypothetical protein